MKKIHSFLYALFASLAITLVCCSDPNPAPDPEPDPKNNGEEPIEEPELAKLVLSIPITGDQWIFQDKPSITIHAQNPNDQAMTAEAKVVITTDKKGKVVTLEKSMEIAGKAEQDIVFTTDDPLPAGFYRASTQAA